MVTHASEVLIITCKITQYHNPGDYHHHPPWFDHPDHLDDWWVKTMPVTMQFSAHSCYFLPLSQIILLNVLFSVTVNLCLSLQAHMPNSWVACGPSWCYMWPKSFLELYVICSLNCPNFSTFGFRRVSNSIFFLSRPLVGVILTYFHMHTNMCIHACIHTSYIRIYVIHTCVCICTHRHIYREPPKNACTLYLPVS